MRIQHSFLIVVILTALPAAAAPVTYFTGHIKSEADLSPLLVTGVTGAVNFSTSPIRTAPFSATNPDPTVALEGISFAPTAGTGNAGISGTVGGVSYSIGGFQNDTLGVNNIIGYDSNRQSGVDYTTSPSLYGLVYDVIRTSANNIMMSVNFSNLVASQAYTFQFVFSSGDAQRRLYLDNASATSSASPTLAYGVTDGVGVLTAIFTADSSGSQTFQFFNTNAGSQRVSLAGFTVAKVASSYSLSLDTNQFLSGATKGTFIGQLTGFAPGADPDATSYSLVTGEGSTDNNFFQIVGDQLQIGNHDFRGDSQAGLTTYSVRIRAKNSATPALQGERAITLVMSEDDDLDGLPDDWERLYSNDLTLLSGLNNHDADGDGLTDLDEYLFSSTYPGLNPLKADTDGDGLTDYEEIYTTSTNPAKADSDNDGANDGDEVRLGTNPSMWDSDGDGWRDGVEIAQGTNPLDANSRPTIPASIGLGVLTDDASTGISTSRIYTHTISGGAAATINGVTFGALTTTATPANFTWTPSSGLKNAIVNNNNKWLPAQGGVTGTGLLSLLGSFVYPGGTNPGDYEDFTLTNLTPGKSYEARVYLRSWDTGGVGRPIDLTFTNGTEKVVPFGAIMLDWPDVTFPGKDRNSAYYISYRYVAQGTQMTIRGTIPQTEVASNPATGSMHLYGLSNEQLAVAANPLKTTSVTRSAAGEILISFTGTPSHSYRVTKSPDLSTAFGPLTIPISVTTDASGVGQVTIPKSEASESKEFYRIEE